MGYVTKTVTEGVGDVLKTTSHMFETLEDLLRWERSQVSDQEEKVGGEVVRRYRVIGNVSGHGFGAGEEVIVVTVHENGEIRASNGEAAWWMIEEELEEV